jgi:hypothetical protein
MTDLLPPQVPELSDDWVAGRRVALVDELTRPRHSSSRSMRTGVLLAVGTATAAALSTLAVTYSGGAPYAFAGWSADPTPPGAGELQQAQAVCQARLDQALHNGSAPGPITPLGPLLSDVRGPFTVTVFGSTSPAAFALCLSAPGAESLRFLTRHTPPPGPDAVSVDGVSFLSRYGQGYTLLEGRVGSAVRGVTMVLDDGRTVTPTTGNGLFVAWWPGAVGITSATVSTASGSTTEPLDVPGPVSLRGSKSS